MSQYIHDEGTFEGSKATKMYFQFFKPKSYKNIIIYIHSMGEHSGRYRFPIEYFIDKKIAFYGMDQRGHGKSGGKWGHIDSFSQYLEDLKTFHNIIKKREEDKRIFLMGQGLGGLIVVRYIQEYQDGIAGAILTSSTFKSKHQISPFVMNVGNKLSRFIPRFAFTNEVDPVFLTHDKDVVKKYMEDDLVHNKVTARFFTEFIDALKVAFQKAEVTTLPMLILQAGADEVVNPEGSQEFFDAVASKDKDIIIYQGMYHEIFNEIGREKVYKDVESWLKPRLS
jgi:acylglycerol lipase